jgi:uncharacterized iron-regulated membrane protein
MFLVRTLHKWVGLILGLQFVLWTISGAMMALLDHHKVSAEATVAMPAATALPATVLPLSAVASEFGAPITKLRLRPLGGRYIYEATTPAGVRMIDAATGAPLVVTEADAAQIARSNIQGRPPVASVALVRAPTIETRALPLPLWRVEFADDEHTTLLVSRVTGEVLERRNDTWRLWDVFWMIHIMDYSKRESFNHPLIITVATGVAWLALSGLILLFRSFRPRDVAWILDGFTYLRGALRSVRR